MEVDVDVETTDIDSATRGAGFSHIKARSTI
jgi:hypothetical protein